MKAQKIISYLLFSALGALLPVIALAQTDPALHPLNPVAAGSAAELYGRIIRAFLGAIGSVALLFIIIGGFIMLTSRGNAEKVKSGRDTVVWATIGLIVAFSAWIILRFVIISVVQPTS